jgi:hypothetical protein
MTPRRLCLETLEGRSLLTIVLELPHFEFPPEPPDEYRLPNVGERLSVVAYEFDQYVATNPPCFDFQPTIYSSESDYSRLRYSQGRVLVDAATLNEAEADRFFSYFRNELGADVVSEYSVWITAWVPVEKLRDLAGAPDLAYAWQARISMPAHDPINPPTFPPSPRLPSPLPPPGTIGPFDLTVKTTDPAFVSSQPELSTFAASEWDSGRIDLDLFKVFAGDESIRRPKAYYSFPGAIQDTSDLGWYGQVEPDGTVQVQLDFRTRDPQVIDVIRSQVTRLGSHYSGASTGIADAWIKLEDLVALNGNEDIIRVSIPFGVVFR